MGATTRDSDVENHVESGTPPLSKNILSVGLLGSSVKRSNDPVAEAIAYGGTASIHQRLGGGARIDTTALTV